MISVLSMVVMPICEQFTVFIMRSKKKMQRGRVEGEFTSVHILLWLVICKSIPGGFMLKELPF